MKDDAAPQLLHWGSAVELATWPAASGPAPAAAGLKHSPSFAFFGMPTSSPPRTPTLDDAARTPPPLRSAADPAPPPAPARPRQGQTDSGSGLQLPGVASSFWQHLDFNAAAALAATGSPAYPILGAMPGSPGWLGGSPMASSPPLGSARHPLRPSVGPHSPKAHHRRSASFSAAAAPTTPGSPYGWQQQWEAQLAQQVQSAMDIDAPVGHPGAQLGGERAGHEGVRRGRFGRIRASARTHTHRDTHAHMSPQAHTRTHARAQARSPPLPLRPTAA